MFQKDHSSNYKEKKQQPANKRTADCGLLHIIGMELVIQSFAGQGSLLRRLESIDPSSC